MESLLDIFMTGNTCHICILYNIYILYNTCHICILYSMVHRSKCEI